MMALLDVLIHFNLSARFKDALVNVMQMACV